MGLKREQSIGEILARLEAQAAFHREREAFHAHHEAHHREHRTVHATELTEILRRLEAFRTAAAEAADFAARPEAATTPQSLAKEDVGTPSRPKVHRMLEIVIADQGAEPFGPAELTGEVNRRFGKRLRKPLKPGQVSAALRRLERKGLIHLVRPGRPHQESLYAREAPEESNRPR